MKTELRDLTIGYRDGQHTAVEAHALNAAVEEGSLTCLVGRNGVGKSTLLRTMALFLPPLEGQVLFDGVDASTLSRHERAVKVGVVLTDRTDTDALTVREVVAMGRAPFTGFWGTLRTQDNEAVEEAMDVTGIAALADKRLSRISDGERQKVMTAKALAQQTPFILLDEPTAFLDYPSKTATLDMLRRLAHEHGKTIFLSTHDLDIAMPMADCVWLMDSDGLTVNPSAEQMKTLNYTFLRREI